MLKDIKKITAELTDKMSAKCIEIADLPFRYKHTTFSASLYAPLIWLICTTESFFYEVKNLKDAVNYENG